MLNRVVLVGHLTADPELKYTPQGVPVAQLRIAVNRVTRNESGDYDVDFFNLVAWRRTAEFAGNYLKKGRLVAVDGRLRTRSWTDQNTGQKRSVVEIEVENLQGLGPRPEGGPGPEPDRYEEGARQPAPVSEPQRHEPGARQPAAAAAPASVRHESTADSDLDEHDPFADE